MMQKHNEIQKGEDKYNHAGVRQKSFSKLPIKYIVSFFFFTEYHMEISYAPQDRSEKVQQQ